MKNQKEKSSKNERVKFRKRRNKVEKILSKVEKILSTVTTFLLLSILFGYIVFFATMFYLDSKDTATQQDQPVKVEKEAKPLVINTK